MQTTDPVFLKKKKKKIHEAVLKSVSVGLKSIYSNSPG